jgi:acyl carrier protein
METVVSDVIRALKPEFDIDVNQDLVGTGVLDSFDLLLLVSDLEAATGLNIPGICLTPEHFYNVKSISSLLDSLKGADDAS